MSVRKRGKGKWYWMDDMVNGTRYRLPLKTTNWQEALRREKEILGEIQAGKFGEVGPIARQTFTAAADAFLKQRQLHSATSTVRTDSGRSQALRRFFGDTQLRRITAETVVKYQAERREAGISGRTVNHEVSLLRRVMKRYRQWQRLADEVQALPVQTAPIRVLSPEEKANLLEMAATKPEWQTVRCAALVALNTTMRGCEIKGLRWQDVDLFERTLTIRRQSTKTDAGARVIPLNRDAVVALAEQRERAGKLGAVEPGHYVFPACEGGHIRPQESMKYWTTSWRSLTRAAGLLGLRFHDLRHQAITELAEGSTSEMTIMAIAGHVSRRMLEHYSHSRLEAKRRALEALETQPPKAVEQDRQDELPTRPN